MVLSANDEAMAARQRTLRNQGMADCYEYRAVGHNWRMTELQAAVAVPQVAAVRPRNARRAANAARLSEGLAHLTDADVDEVVQTFRSLLGA